MAKYPKLSFVFIFLTLAFACKKPNEKPNTASVGFHLDNHIDFSVGGFNYTLSTAWSKDNASAIVISSNSVSETEGNRGFRIMKLDNQRGLNSVIVYKSRKSYTLQGIAAATLDGDLNSYVGGHYFESYSSYGRPYLIKINERGEIVYGISFYHEKDGTKETYRCAALEALANGDVVMLAYARFAVKVIRLSPQGEIKWITAIHNSTDAYDFEGKDRSKIMKAGNGDLFMTAGNGILLKLSQTGTLQFIKQLRIGNNSLIEPENIGLLLTADGNLVYYGNTKPGTINPKHVPFLFWIDAKNGRLMRSKTYDPETNEVKDLQLNTIIPVDNGYRAIFTGESQYNTAILDAELQPLKQNRTLGLAGTIFPTPSHVLYNAHDNMLYHIIDMLGRRVGGGFQLLQTDMNGKGCQDYKTVPWPVVFSDSPATSIDLQVEVLAGELNMQDGFEMEKTIFVNFSVQNECGQ